MGAESKALTRAIAGIGLATTLWAASGHAQSVPADGKMSWAPFGGQTNGASFGVGVSGDGRYVVYGSAASNIIAGDANGYEDVFMYDRLTRLTLGVSVTSSLTFAQGTSQVTLKPNGVTPDGRYVVFQSMAPLDPSDTNNMYDTYVRDVTGFGSTRRASLRPDGRRFTRWCSPVGITGDGRYVFFSSDEAVDSGDTNGKEDVFRRDLVANTTTRVTNSVPGGISVSAITRDGRYLLFSTTAALSTRDRNGASDVYLQDLSLRTTTLISADASGNAIGGSAATMSNNGDAIAYATPTREPRVYHRASRTLRTPLPRSPDTNPLSDCRVSSLSFDGRYAAVRCNHLYPGTTRTLSQGFCYDLFTGVNGMYSRSASGAEGNGDVQPWVHLADDGRGLVMASSASNLVANDTNGRDDTFLAFCR